MTTEPVFGPSEREVEGQRKPVPTREARVLPERPEVPVDPMTEERVQAVRAVLWELGWVVGQLRGSNGQWTALASELVGQIEAGCQQLTVLCGGWHATEVLHRQ